MWRCSMFLSTLRRCRASRSGRPYYWTGHAHDEPLAPPARRPRHVRRFPLRACGRGRRSTGGSATAAADAGAALQRTGPRRRLAARRPLLAGRQARHLPAGQRRIQGPARPVGARHRDRSQCAAGRFAQPGRRRGQALARGRGPPRAAAHRRARRHRRLPVLAGLAAAAHPDRGRPLPLRPQGPARRPSGAASDEHRGGGDRRALLAARPLCELRARAEPLRHRGRHRPRDGGDAGRRWPRVLRHGGVHRPGGDGPRHGLLVVARRAHDRARARRRIHRGRGRALRDPRRERARDPSALSGRRTAERARRSLARHARRRRQGAIRDADATRAAGRRGR